MAKLGAAVPGVKNMNEGEYMKESDLFIYIKDYFLANPNNEIYTEVLGLGGGRPDIVLRTNKKIITIIEMKTTLSMNLLEQAINWRYKANYVYIAIPEPKTKNINGFARKILADYGIGLLFIDIPTKEIYEKYYKDGEDNSCKYLISEKIKPKFFRTKKEIIDWNVVLKDIYRYENNIKGGSKGGGYNTPYKDLICDVKKYVYRKGNEFVPIGELIEKISSIRSHYSNPKASLHSALTEIERNQFEVKVVNNQIYFRLTEEAYKNYDVYSWR